MSEVQVKMVAIRNITATLTWYSSVVYIEAIRTNRPMRIPDTRIHSFLLPYSTDVYTSIKGAE